MSSARVQGAAQGAQAGARIGSVVPGVGSGIGAGVGAVIGGLFSKGTYAQGTGLRAVGYVDKDGFHGTVFGLAENAGQKYQDTLTGWAPQSTLSAKAAAAFAETFGPNSTQRLQVDFVGPLTETGSDPQFSNAFVDALKSSAGGRGGDLADSFDGAAVSTRAPAMGARAPAGVPSVMQPVSILPAQQENSGGSALPLLALLAGAAYVMR